MDSNAEADRDRGTATESEGGNGATTAGGTLADDVEGSATPARFEEVDWETHDRDRSVSTDRIGFVLLAGTMLLAWLLDARYGSDHVPIVAVEIGSVAVTFNPGNVDWLFALTLLAIGSFVIVPLARNPRLTARYWRTFKRNRAAVASLGFLCCVLAVGIVGPTFLGRPEIDLANAHQPPVGLGGTLEHPLGTTRSGEDLLRIVAIGMRVSMQVGLIGTAIVVVLATAIGTTAAYVGGWVDEALMRFVDVVLTFPTFFLVLFVIYLFGGDLFTIVVVLGLTTWAATSRIVRSEALQRSEEAYVTASESAGASRTWIVTRHLVPNVSNTVITAATLVIPSLILYEAVLAFLGLGDPGVWSWGRAIAEGRGELERAPWVSTIPGLFLFATVLAFNFLGDALRDAMDPRHE